MDSYTAQERRRHGRKLAQAREVARVAEIMARSAAAEGVKVAQIAAELGVDQAQIKRWIGK